MKYEYSINVQIESLTNWTEVDAELVIGSILQQANIKVISVMTYNKIEINDQQADGFKE